ncbi:MAG: hypothetical protein AAFQ94_15050 [Bacteroidota bacterium]
MSHHSSGEVLKAFGASEDVLEELLQYFDHSFESKGHIEQAIEDMPQISAYNGYVEEAKNVGAFEALRRQLKQLQLPVRAGMSQTESYKKVVLRGNNNTDSEMLALNAPDNISLEVYEDELIGKIPVLLVPNKEDFALFICALTNKNEPKEVPSSMGALFINGLNNWGRIHRLKEDWISKNPFGNWSEEFKSNVLPNKSLYKDQLIILSEQPYSNVSAENLQLDPTQWKSYSVAIRRAHECAHLFTLQRYGKIKHHLFDELIADYAGITSVLGRFQLEWFLHFMGLENPQQYREGGRFQNYVPGLSDESRQMLQKILVKAAINLANFDETLGAFKSPTCRKSRIQAICETGMLSIASADGVNQLMEKYNSHETSLV